MVKSVNANSDKQFVAFADLMKSQGLQPLAIEVFKKYYTQLVNGESGLIAGGQIDPVEDAPDFDKLNDFRFSGEKAIDHTVMIKLNGGLGTGMGLDKAKSLLSVKNELSFLDIIVKQVLYLRSSCNSSLPLILMNSFRTEADALAVLERYPDLQQGQKGVPFSFVQNKVPKVLQENFQPVEWGENPALEWCPPGHGDIYTALQGTGLLDQLLEKGFNYAYVSNADNLGALLDLQILGYFVENKIPFLMEVADRTEADKKGGHLARSKKGGLLLRESAQCPGDESEDFQDISKYRYFNTNSLWLNLKALKSSLEENGGMLSLPLICNSKTVDPTDSKSPKVFQLETAMGAAISSFSDASALRVPRSRFAPVKKTDDLLALWSDIFNLVDSGHIVVNPERKLGTVVINLDSTFYKTVGDFEKRFPAGVPSMLACKSLKIVGDFRFGKGVVLKGDVELVNDSSEQIFIEDYSVIEG